MQHVDDDRNDDDHNVLSSALTLSLPQQADATGAPIVECNEFVDGITWGPVQTADINFYCPPTLRTLSATNRGVNAATSFVTFNVGNVDTLNGSFNAFNEVAGPNAGSFDWGLSFFFGRTIFTAIEGQSTPGGTGPYWAY